MSFDTKVLNVDGLIEPGKKLRVEFPTEHRILLGLKKEAIKIWQDSDGDRVIINGKTYRLEKES